MNYLSAVLILLAILAIGAFAEKKGDQTTYLKRVGKKFLDEVASREGIVKIKYGILVEIIKKSEDPDAKSPKSSDPCEVTYKGTFKDGNQFDAGTTSFAPNQVIKGWTEAMQLMGEGDKWKLYIPYDLAYGERGSPPRIPGYSPLVFEIEIHKVKSGGKPVAEARKMFDEAIAPKQVDL